MINVFQATEAELCYVDTILSTIELAAEKRGTGIAKRSPLYVEEKIKQGKAIIAIDDANKAFVGFCYIENWEGKKFVANSGLIVTPEYRGQGIAKRIKQTAFELSRKKYPHSKLFGLTTGLAVMKINSDLGYRPVPFSELTDDEAFWAGCKTCINYDILQRTEKKYCLCTGMLFDPNIKDKKNNK